MDGSTKVYHWPSLVYSRAIMYIASDVFHITYCLSPRLLTNALFNPCPVSSVLLFSHLAVGGSCAKTVHPQRHVVGAAHEATRSARTSNQGPTWSQGLPCGAMTSPTLRRLLAMAEDALYYIKLRLLSLGGHFGVHYDSQSCLRLCKIRA